MSDSYKPFANNFQSTGTVKSTNVENNTAVQQQQQPSSSLPKREDENVMTPIVRSLLGFVQTTKDTIPELNNAIDNGFKSAAKGFVNTVDVVAIRDNYRKAVDLVDRSPPLLIVASATLLPIILFKKVPSVKDPALAALGFGASMYYCYPELVSKGSKKVLEFYKTQTNQLNNNSNATAPVVVSQPPKDKQ
ncbi:hypothetical protein PPL_09285 [Heterostelium album PN500]|uniref:MICOS complex subunit n=1 Tax=Heterostelium pallidum (strain ATCC 26659 / Pp 5 / PN500) TaxID=670386 RepID=D3BL53_HETP5|nr:hypothetical protein PPL_09285 [Heterostelium album PN500]EFA77787.1 hypothetical protein PPL_09285 [Heterostelium album PN500]|eukprot:XP_020429915.1 hypothetical protein PPL_09285 [Heterostelium album PN500]